MERMLFEERQWFAPWVFLLLAAIAAAALYFLAVNGVSGAAALSAAPLPCVMLVLLNLLHVRTRVTDRRVTAHLGFLFPMFWRSIPLEDIVSEKAIVYRPLRDAGGWGYRWGRFEGYSCMFINARGDKGVLLETRQRKWLVIGSMHPAALCEAIASARKAMRT